MPDLRQADPAGVRPAVRHFLLAVGGVEQVGLATDDQGRHAHVSQARQAVGPQHGDVGLPAERVGPHSPCHGKNA
ncbi:hypothetical protein G6F24_018946 [Rhizopus arrhizus]|nr:hypothetical protein G6F24_018946 [Rhizopus arrhizus]